MLLSSSTVENGIFSKQGAFKNSYTSGGAQNIRGTLTFIATHDLRANGSGSLFYVRSDTNNHGQVSVATSGDWKADPSLDASRSSALYKDGLSEIRVNALYGLNLIRAF